MNVDEYECSTKLEKDLTIRKEGLDYMKREFTRGHTYIKRYNRCVKTTRIDVILMFSMIATRKKKEIFLF